MTFKTCLLVTDDPDDHQAFSEALSEISPQTIALIVLDGEKALDLIRVRKHIPDFIFMDLSTHGIKINSFLKVVKGDTELSHIPLIVYGDQSGMDKIDDSANLIFFKKDYEYSELKSFLQTFIPLSDRHNGMPGVDDSGDVDGIALK